MSVSYAVLGCGPAGLMATHALAREGADFDIISKPAVPSRIGGAQYLHASIPGLTEADPDGRIMVVKQGTAGGYAAKVGRLGQSTSWSNYEFGLLGVWNLQRAYERLWLLYGANIIESSISYMNIDLLRNSYDAVISTIPKSVLCRQPRRHQFAQQKAWIRTGDDLGVPADCMVYNGTPEGWYRASNIFYSQSKEYSYEIPGGKLVLKPLWNDCDCNPWIFYLGRYGCWEKRWLTNDAYTGARDIARTLQNVGLYSERGGTQRSR